MIVVKRDGREVQYDPSKVRRAVQEAFKAVDKELTDETKEKVEQIGRYVDEFTQDKITVEEIQDFIEYKLMTSNRKDVAKQYIIYRNNRTIEREKKSTIIKKVARRINASSVDNNNANVDERSFSGREKEASADVGKSMAIDYGGLSKKVANAHKEMLVYQHDLEKAVYGEHNCLFLNFQEIFKNGFKTRNGDVRPPSCFSTACQQVAVAFQCQSQVQFGGVASMHLDYDLAPFIKMSFAKHLKDGIEYILDEKDEFLDELLENKSVNIDNEYIKNKYPKLYKYAYNMLLKECKQSCEALYHNLNTLESRQGSQVPFTSINIGRDTSPEGRLVTKSILEASIAGIGKFHLTSIFPISIFSTKKGINMYPGDPNYDLKQLALKSMSMRIYPNWVNGDWSQMNENPDDIDTYACTMGCVDSESIIRFRFNNQTEYNESIKMLWNRAKTDLGLSSLQQVKDNNNDLYIKTDYSNIEIYDTKRGFVKVKKIIRNLTDKWIRLTFNNSIKLDCTYDHPLPTQRGRVYAEDLQIGDIVEYNDNGNITQITLQEIYKYKTLKYSFDVETESDYFEVNNIYSHNCRTALGFDRHGLGYKRQGRGNNVPNTIILPKIAIENGICLGERTEPDLEGFWSDLDKALKICEQGLLERYNIIKRQSPKAAPFMYQNNTIQGAKECSNTVEPAVKHGTLGIGLIGIAEMCKALFGKTHDEDKEVHKFALSVVQHMYDYAKDASERNDLNFGVYFTPELSVGAYTVMCNEKVA